MFILGQKISMAILAVENWARGIFEGNLISRKPPNEANEPKQNHRFLTDFSGFNNFLFIKIVDKIFQNVREKIFSTVSF